MRRLATALIATAMLVGTSAPLLAAPPCKDAKGRFIRCPPAPAARCKGTNGKFVKCGTPGAKPVR